MAFIFPLYYYLTATALAPMRLHHSFIGLAFQLLPFRPLQILGAYQTMDSAMYMIFPNRSKIDFQNILLEDLNAYVLSMTIACGMQFLVSSAIRAAKRPNSEQAQPVIT
jgi:hypothetical protein